MWQSRTGEVRHSAITMTVSEEEGQAFARRYDRNDIHILTEAARGMGYPRVSLPGPMIASVSVRLVQTANRINRTTTPVCDSTAERTTSAGAGASASASTTTITDGTNGETPSSRTPHPKHSVLLVSRNDERLHQPCFAGEAFRTQSTKLAQRLTSTGDRGVLRNKIELLNGRDEVVWSAVSTLLVSLHGDDLVYDGWREEQPLPSSPYSMLPQSSPLSSSPRSLSPASSSSSASSSPSSSPSSSSPVQVPVRARAAKL